MTTKADDRKTDRHNFLKLAGLGSVVGGAALVSGKEAEAAVADAPGKGAGYAETDHVKAFYKTARF